MKIRAAAVQMVSTDNVDENLDNAARLINEAVRDGAAVVVLPENFAFMGRNDEQRLEVIEPPGAEPPSSAPMQNFLAQQSAQHQVWLVGGTIPVGQQASEKASSAMLLYNPQGQQQARYDKIHLFDVNVPGGSENYRESRSTSPGTTPVVANMDQARLGLSICYDLRFPELFRTMVGAGADLFALASAFTVPTGKAHWETLVRARAIENLTAVVAACQGGRHRAGRETYGHSMIVDCWGRILDSRTDGPGVVVAEIDLAAQRRIRDSFPVLNHRRL